MGKIRRVRQKLHQSLNKDRSDTSKDSSIDVSYESQLSGKSPLLKTQEELAAIPDNLFEGIDINFDDLKKKLDDDRVSVRSIAKSCKYDSNGKLLTKKEKKKIKHDLFMRKINTVEQLKKEALQKHKKRKGLKKNDQQLNINSIQSPIGLEIGTGDIVADDRIGISTSRERKIKPKGIKKRKVRQREMLQDISTFQKILSDPKFSEDPFAAIAENVRERILTDRQEERLNKRKENSK